MASGTGAVTNCLAATSKGCQQDQGEFTNLTHFVLHFDFVNMRQIVYCRNIFFQFDKPSGSNNNRDLQTMQNGQTDENNVRISSEFTFLLH